ncbi:MAG TPA: UPF0182 family protein, partial [Gemmatimonadaceae bacterium]|nr:UPF0182 family protein [Gemmatimonadaceae bacterium]
AAAVIAFAFALANLYALRRSIVSLVLPRRLGNIEIGEAVSTRMLLAYVVGVAAVLGVLLSAPTGDWTTIALARIAEPFREIDPFLDRDLSFAVAQLPFAFDVFNWAGRVMVVTAGLIVGLYALTPSLRLRRGSFYISVYCRRHLAVLASLALLLLAWQWRLDGLSLTSRTAEAGGPYNAYWNGVGAPLLAWIAVGTGVASFTVLWAGWNGYGRVAALAGVLAAVGGPAVSETLPRLTQRTLTAADLREEDRPFANTRVLFTRRAFGVDAIDSMPPGFAPARSPADAMTGVPRWDPAAIVRSVPGGAAGGDSAAVAWQPTRGGIEASVVSRRPGGSGWSLATFDAATADDRGGPLPALPSDANAAPPAGWARLLVFPGADEPVVVSDTGGHLPAPAFTTWWERVTLAWSVRAPRLLAADPADVRPRLAFHRDVRDRLHEIVPFLTIGPTISPLVRGDSLYWVAELFTTSDTYPLSDRLFFAGRERAYVHHAATAYVQAMTGAVTLVATPRPDAIMRAWMRRFPEMFAAATAVPGAVVARHAPLVDWARLQATAMARTGLGPAAGGPRGTRAAAGADNVDADLATGPPTLFALPGAGVLAWSVPIVNAAGFVIGGVLATGGASPRTIWLPTSREDRWADILDRLQRAADSAGVGRQRPNARRGRVLALPFADGLWYAQAHYEWGTDRSPMLAGTAVFANGTARAASTLADALGATRTSPPFAPASFRASVDELYRRMDDALRRGDWPAFGTAFAALGRLVRGSRNP